MRSYRDAVAAGSVTHSSAMKAGSGAGGVAAVAPRSGHGGGRWGAYCPAIHRQIASTT